jgi:hypothetical protein
MKISKETLRILKGFMHINPSIFVKKGNVIRTMDAGENMMGSAVVEENFPVDFAIYDLPNFLNVISMFPDADIDFENSPKGCCSITYEGHSSEKVLYVYAPDESVESYDADLNIPESEINFEMTQENLQKLFTAAKTMALKHLLITPSDGKTVIATVTNVGDPSSNTFSVKLDADLSIEDFSVVFDIEYFTKIDMRSYKVHVSSAGASHFETKNLQYWICLEQQTHFGE